MVPSNRRSDSASASRRSHGLGGAWVPDNLVGRAQQEHLSVAAPYSSLPMSPVAGEVSRITVLGAGLADEVSWIVRAEQPSSAVPVLTVASASALPTCSRMQTKRMQVGGVNGTAQPAVWTFLPAGKKTRSMCVNVAPGCLNRAW